MGGKREEKQRKRGKKIVSTYIHTYIMNTTYMAYMGLIDLLNAKLSCNIIDLYYIMSNAVAGFVCVIGRIHL